MQRPERKAMPSKGRKLRLRDYLPYRLSVATNAVSRLIARAYETEFSLKIPQWRLLAVLADEGPMTQQALCGQTIMDKVTVMRAAQGLLQRRLIKRLPNARDGRSHRLAMTAAGKRLYEQIVPLALNYQTQLLTGIERSDIARLEQMLSTLEQSATALTGGLEPGPRAS
jgi:DNA-binding MarR family transcriptional regulator